MEELGNTIFGLLLAIFVIALFVWLTWYVVLWLAGSLVLYLIFRWRAKRAAEEVATSGTGRLRQSLRQSLYEGLRDTILCAVWGLAVLTLVQLVLNAVQWITGPDEMFDAAVTRALWSSEALVGTLRHRLTTVLSPRITFPLLGAAVFLSVYRPDWRPVKRVFGVRSWVGRMAKVALVISSMSFFTSEYAALHESGLVQLRLQRIGEAHDRSTKALHRLVAAEWTAAQLTQASPSEKADTVTFLKAADKSGYGARIVDAEAQRFVERWGGKPTTAGEESPEAAKSVDPTAEAVWEEPPRRSVASVVAAFRGPPEPWPGPEVVARAEAQSSRTEAQAAEAEAAAVEVAKQGLGAMVPEGLQPLEPLLRQFVKVATDAVAKTVVKDWFSRHDESIKVALANPVPFAQQMASSLPVSLSKALREESDPTEAAPHAGNNQPKKVDEAVAAHEAIAAGVVALATKYKGEDVAAEKAAAEARKQAATEDLFGRPASPWSREYGPHEGPFERSEYRPTETYHPYEHPMEHFSGFHGGRR